MLRLLGWGWKLEERKRDMPKKDAKLIFGEETIDFRVPETVTILEMKKVA